VGSLLTGRALRGVSADNGLFALTIVEGVTRCPNCLSWGAGGGHGSLVSGEFIPGQGRGGRRRFNHKNLMCMILKGITFYFNGALISYTLCSMQQVISFQIPTRPLLFPRKPKLKKKIMRMRI
jgi:hypothetical protein